MIRTRPSTSASSSCAPHRKRKYSARAFYLTLLIITAIAAFSFLADLNANLVGSQRDAALQRREREDVPIQDLECRLVHTAHDKCAFIKANCPDEEAGLFSYLTLYYCRLPHAKPVAFIIITLWLGLLFSTIGIAASDFFCINLSTIANILGMSESMAGVTFLAFGNGSSDIFSTFAAMSTHSGSLAVGELIGAASFITAVVAGSMALVRPFKVARKSFVRDVGFFIVAVSFSMSFLADGSLRLWECAVMVAFYVFYVCVVVVWHWWLTRRRRRREKEAAARGHFIIPGSEDLEVQEEYQDEYHDDEEAAPSRRPSVTRGVSAEDLRMLEQGDVSGEGDVDEDVEEEARDRWLGELSSNMRLSRPSPGERHTSTRPIRPSLVGALEFRAVLSSLHHSRNIHTVPMNLRRYSDGPSNLLDQQQTNHLDPSDPGSRSAYEVNGRAASRSVAGDRPSLELLRPASDSRVRAVSVNDTARAPFDSGLLQRDHPPVGLLHPPPAHATSILEDRVTPSTGLLSPVISVSPPPTQVFSNPALPVSQMNSSSNLLAPPDQLDPSARTSNQPAAAHDAVNTNKPSQSPRTEPRPYPKLTIPKRGRAQGSSPSSPFPSYTDYSLSGRSSPGPPSIVLPPGAYAESYFDGAYEVDEQKPLRWWPYSLLPPPGVLYSTLFPTLYGWREKNLWGRMLGLVSAPSVFLLTITLPVVESEKEEGSEEQTNMASPQNLALAKDGAVIHQPHDPPGHATNTQPPDIHDVDPPRIGKPAVHNDTAAVAARVEHENPLGHSKPPQMSDEPYNNNEWHTQIASSPASSTKAWNRWLVIVQCFTAPFFVLLVVWANTSDDLEDGRGLLRLTLYSLLGSLLALTFILITTTPSRPPRWHVLLCFVGFAVSIAWISTIANEVVGVLKTIGVVLDISDAILGLTIFAVGNSLGDLVANITVARLGYPVMALSACFGGPMLNILLGIGLSGLYMTIRGAEHRHHNHPSQPIKYKPYEIEISSTLLISAVTLLVTLVGLLVLVPWNGWRMDKRIGWGLLALWSISTIGNLVVEIIGWGGHIRW